MRVVVAGGGSAGHIEPALALADALREADSGIAVTALGTREGLEARLVPMRGYELEFIPKVPLPRSISADLLTVPGRLAGAVHTTGQILDRVRADVLVGFGGFVSAPAYLAAKRHHVPIVVHEANPSAGFANKLGAMLTTDVYTGHPDTKLRGGQYLGLPIRRQIAELDRFKLGDAARTHFGLRMDLPVLLVTGGSQGATSLNQATAGAAQAIRNAGVQILHVTGPKHADALQQELSRQPPGPVPYVTVPYVDRMDLAYAAADFALCRAGAMTCAELTAVGLPAAYVPLPHGNGEQVLNAQPIVAKGGGLLVEDHELTAEWVIRSILPVLTNIDRVAAMSEAASSMGRKDADRALAKAVIDVVAREKTAAVAAGAPTNGPGPDNDPLDEPVSNTGQFRLDPASLPSDPRSRPAPESAPRERFDAFSPPGGQQRPQQGQYPRQAQSPWEAAENPPQAQSPWEAENPWETQNAWETKNPWQDQNPQQAQYPQQGQYPGQAQNPSPGRHRR